jgi:hypothetical protein
MLISKIVWISQIVWERGDNQKALAKVYYSGFQMG